MSFVANSLSNQRAGEAANLDGPQVLMVGDCMALPRTACGVVLRNSYVTQRDNN